MWLYLSNIDRSPKLKNTIQEKLKEASCKSLKFLLIAKKVTFILILKTSKYLKFIKIVKF